MKAEIANQIVQDRIDHTAGTMYTAYCAAVGGKAFDGSPLPAWDEFSNDPAKQKQSAAWFYASAVAHVEIMHAAKHGGYNRHTRAAALELPLPPTADA